MAPYPSADPLNSVIYILYVKAAIEGLGRSQCNVLVAHDWGGAVGYAFCDQWPQMVGHYVTLNIPHPRLRYKGF